MKKDDQMIKEYLQRETEGLKLAQSQKALLQKAMQSELAQTSSGPVARIARKAGLFWESTFEINLAPVAAAAAVVILVGGAVFFGPQQLVNKPEQPRQVIYLQQTVAGPGGETGVVFIPLERQ